MPTLLERKEKRASIWSQMQEIRSEYENAGSEWSSELLERWEKAERDMQTVEREIRADETDAELTKRYEKIDRDTIVTQPDGEPASRAAYDEAFGAYLRGGLSGLEDDQKVLLRNNHSVLQRAEGVTTGNLGGYTVPQGFWAKITETLKYFGGMIDVAEVLNTDTGNDIPWPTNDDTANTGALLAENTQITTQDVTFGQAMLHAYTYTSNLILASLQFLQDTGVDAEGFIARKIGQRLGRIWNKHLTTGTGAAQPQGLITAATNGATSTNAAAIIYDDLVNLIHSVDVAYRNFNPRWMFHDLILAAIRKLKDTQGHPLWQPQVQVGVPDMLLGYQYTVNNDMASTTTTGNKIIAFGSFQLGYVVRQVAGGQLVRLEERFADFLQVGFFGFGRIDGLLQDPSAVKLLVTS